MDTNVEARRLLNRARVYTIGCLAALSLQGPFLANAIRGGSDPVRWIVWSVVLLLAVLVIALLLPRATRMAKRYRQLEWDEK